MSTISKCTGGWNLVGVNLWLTDAELADLEMFRKNTEDQFRADGFFKEHENYPLDDAVLYLLGEAIKGRVVDIHEFAFKKV